MLQAQPGRAAAAEGPHMQPPAAAFQLHPWAVSLGTPQKQLRTANRPYATHSPLNYFYLNYLNYLNIVASLINPNKAIAILSYPKILLHKKQAF